MTKTIHLRINKECDSGKMPKILKFKGILITRGYTEIIHIADEDTKYWRNYFSVSPADKKTVEEFITHYITEHDLTDSISLVTGSPKPLQLQEA